MPFSDRRDAGRRLADALEERYPDGLRHPIVLGLPRGGVPVAAEVAARLGAPLDVMVVRKLGLPAHPELAIGAVAAGGVRVLNEDVVRSFGTTRREIDEVTRAELRELERREGAYRGGGEPPAVADRDVILVDDGLATGATMRAAIAGVRALRPARVIVAVPVAAPDTCHEIARLADDVLCLQTPEPFVAVGRWYRTFDQTTDDEVRQLLRRARVGDP